MLWWFYLAWWDLIEKLGDACVGWLCCASHLLLCIPLAVGHLTCVRDIKKTTCCYAFHLLLCIPLVIAHSICCCACHSSYTLRQSAVRSWITDYDPAWCHLYVFIAGKGYNVYEDDGHIGRHCVWVCISHSRNSELFVVELNHISIGESAIPGDCACRCAPTKLLLYASVL